MTEALSLDDTADRRVVEEKCRKALSRLQHSNVFYRSAGARELVVLAKEGWLRKVANIAEDIWYTVVSVAYNLWKNEEDEDVYDFCKTILDLAEVPKSPEGEFQDPSTLAPPPQRKKLNVDPQAAANGDTYRAYNPWRSALVRSLRSNRTADCKHMELCADRQNHTKINRTVTFRGFVPDTSDAAKDRLYTVVDARVEKAEQTISALDSECAASNLEGNNPARASLSWRFKPTQERYHISGRLRTIRGHRGIKVYSFGGPQKIPEAAEDEALLRLRRIAWNACTDKERDMLLWPAKDEAGGFFPEGTPPRVVNLMRRALQALSVDPDSQEVREPTAVFQSIDKDGSGMINFKEYLAALRLGKVYFAEEDAMELFTAMDQDGSGEIEYGEFDHFMRRAGIPENFWVLCLEPDRVIRVGPGDAYGRSDDSDTKLQALKGEEGSALAGGGFTSGGIASGGDLQVQVDGRSGGRDSDGPESVLREWLYELGADGAWSVGGGQEWRDDSDT